MIIEFDLEASDQEAAFFGIYAGLRMYKEMKDSQPTEEGAFFISAAENYCRLKDLQVQFPEEYAEAEAEYNEIYGKVISVTCETPEQSTPSK